MELDPKTLRKINDDAIVSFRIALQAAGNDRIKLCRIIHRRCSYVKVRFQKDVADIVPKGKVKGNAQPGTCVNFVFIHQQFVFPHSAQRCRRSPRPPLRRGFRVGIVQHHASLIVIYYIVVARLQPQFPRQFRVDVIGKSHNRMLIIVMPYPCHSKIMRFVPGGILAQDAEFPSGHHCKQCFFAQFFRRIVRNRISKLKEDLKKIDRQMAVQRSNRGQMVRVSLVGYTNVGKSTLMNLLSKSDVFAENKLFATLDTTVRKVVFDNLPFLLSDTVGFIRKLPTQLVESFKSTLDEVREADLLLHVVDISHPGFEEQMDVVKQTLREIGAGDKPTFIIFNKIDAYTYIKKDEDDLTPATRKNLSLDDLKRTYMASTDAPCIFISALDRQNIDKLRQDLYSMVREIHAGRYPFNNFLY